MSDVDYAPLTRTQLARVLMLGRTRPDRLIESLCWILDKSGTQRRLVLNRPQQIVMAMVLEDLAAGRPLRYMILKARQEGMSTLIEALLFVFSLCYPNLNSYVLTHERPLSQELLDKTRFFLDNLDERFKVLMPKPSLDRLRMNAIECADGHIPLNSRVQVDTSTGKESGRGKTLHFLHLSEYAFYPAPGRTAKALYPSVPDLPNTAIFIETTANGAGTYFHDQWKKAEQGRGRFRAVFIPWYVLDEYSRTPPDDFELTDDELELASEYQLTDAQLYWRRITIEEDFNGDEDGFDQEFPLTATHAFMRSGSPAFSKKLLIDYRNVALKQPVLYGELDAPAHRPERVKFIETADPESRLTIHRLPEPGHEYLIGADTALGIDNGDFSAAAVIDRTTNRFVATWWGLIDPRSLAHRLAELGYFYNEAKLAPETNNTGMVTLVELNEVLRYPNLWVWRRYDNLKNVYTDKLGWQTNPWSRPMLLDDMTLALREHLVGIPFVQICDELMIVDSGQHRIADDDLAMASMITLHCHLNSPMNDGTTPRAILEEATAAAEANVATDLMSAREWEHVDDLRERLAALAQRDEAGDVLDDYEDESDDLAALAALADGMLSDVPW